MISNRILFLPLIAMFVSTIGGLSGCTSPASQKGMVVSSIPDVHRHSSTVAIISQGGSVSTRGGSIIISNDDFAEAIKESIIKNGLFTKIIHGKDADYVLYVTIVRISNPLFGAKVTVSMFVEWSLFDTGNHVVMRETIKSSYTATMGDAFVAFTRFRLAVEGAVRKNICLGLKAISKLNLEQ